jgi:hypothetical protein
VVVSGVLLISTMVGGMASILVTAISTLQVFPARSAKERVSVGVVFAV